MSTHMTHRTERLLPGAGAKPLRLVHERVDADESRVDVTAWARLYVATVRAMNAERVPYVRDSAA